MQPRFLKLILTRFRQLGAPALLTLALAAVPCAALRAQSPTDPASPTATPKPAHSYVRFWNMLPRNQANILTLFTGETAPVANLPPANVFSSYLVVPVGSYTMIVRKFGEAGEIIQRFPVSMPAGSFITMIATEKDGKPTVEMFNDTPDPKVVETSGQIVLRQFVPGAHVTASIPGGPATTKALDYGETAVLKNVPISGPVQINLQAGLPTTPPTTRSWSLSGNFSTAHHATLLLVADSYGRFRPTLTMDAVAP